MANSKTCPSCGRRITNPDAGFCGGCGAKLPSQSKWWQIATGAVGVLAIVFLIGFYQLVVSPLMKPRPVDDAGSGPPAAPLPAPALPSLFPPKFDVALHRDIFHRNTRGEPPTTLKIVLTDEQPAAIQRVVLNGRAGEEGCDFVREDKVKACVKAVQDRLGPEATDAQIAQTESDAKSAEYKCLHMEYLTYPGVACCRPADDDQVKLCLRNADDSIRDASEGGSFNPAEIRATAAKQFEQAKADCIDSGASEWSKTPWQLLSQLSNESAASEPPWPKALKTGDSITVDGDSCGDQVVNARIITDRGEATYQFH